MNSIIGTYFFIGGLLSFTLALTPRERYDLRLNWGQPFVETYWESYRSYPYSYGNCYSHSDPGFVDENAYCHDLSSIPTDYVDVVNVAFAAADGEYCRNWNSCFPYVCGLHLFDTDQVDAARYAKLKADIKKLRENGAFVKLAYGGEEWGNTRVQIKTLFGLKTQVDQMVRDVEDLGVDGIDLVQEQGFGTQNMNANDLTSIHLMYLQQLRKRLPNHIITYTFPGYALTFPFRDVIQYGHSYVNTINVFRANLVTLDAIYDLGVPKNKLMYGLAIGCNQNSFEDVTLYDAESAANYVKNNGLAGVMTWSINRDTNHHYSNPGPACYPEQTGLPDGTFIKDIKATLTN